MADRAPFQRNTAVAQRLEGTSRTLITGHILRKSAKLTEVAAETGVTTPGVETVIDLVKSDAGSTARQTDAKCRDNADMANTNRHWLGGNLFPWQG
jgi:hypothetical protein